jgi:hypothetical protein
MPYQGTAQTQRAITVEFLQKRRLNAPAVWFRPQGWDPSASDALAETLETDLGMWDAASDRNLGVRLEAGYIELRITSGDDAFAHAFFLACEHLRVDARAAFGIHQISSILLNIAGAGEQQLWPRGFKDKRGHWTEAAPVISSLPTKSAKAVWGYSRPLPGSLLPDGIVAWRPKGKAAALDVLMGIEDLEPRAIAPTTTPVIVRAIAYATLAYWIRVYLDGLTEWDTTLTRRVGGLIARLVREGAAVNADGKSLDGVCWSPIDTPELALDLIAFLGRLGANADLKVAYLHGEAAMARGQQQKVAGWPAVEETFGVDAKQGIRRAMRAGIDLDLIERLSERYALDVQSGSFIDREAIPKGLAYEKKYDDLMRIYENEAIFIGRKRHNPFKLYVGSELRTDVARTDMFPGEEPGALLRYSPLHGLITSPDTISDEYRVLNTYRGFTIKPIGTVDEAVMHRVVSALDKMLGLLTRDNDAQMLWLKKFIAWTILFPDKKQQVAPVIVGGQGIGKSFFGETLMYAVFGDLCGTASAALLDDNSFLITPFIGKLITFVDEVRLQTSGVINEIKKLIRQKRVSGMVKFKDQQDYFIYSRLILAANQADIGLTSQDAADRALFFIVAWTAENRNLTDIEFQKWAWGHKDFYAEFTAMLEEVAVRQHLMRYFRGIECKQSELEDLTESSRFDENVVKATMSKPREVAREIAAAGRVHAGSDLTAWFNIHALRAAILREDGQRSRVEAQAVIKEYEVAGVIESMSGGFYRFKYGYGKVLAELGKAHNLELLPQHHFVPGDFDDNPILSNVNQPPWRGNPKGSDGRRRPFDYSRRDDDDFYDPER